MRIGGAGRFRSDNPDARARPEAGEQAVDVPRRQRDTACRAGSGLGHDMQEDGAASPLDARARVPVQFEHDIILAVVATQRFVAVFEGQPHEPVVAGVARSVAPAQLLARRPQGNPASDRKSTRLNSSH